MLDRVYVVIALGFVRVVTATFSVVGMLRDHEWWGPKLARVTVELFDATGKQIGERTLAPELRRNERVR